jgi:serine/threonine protein kinase/lipoprotein NlpI
MSNIPDIDSMIGKELAGRFQIVKKIGQGGMGAVFKAIHTRMGRACAIKILLPMSSDSDSTSERFKREAQMASRIDNQHAVTIYDFGETETGMLYLAMEYIDGKPLGHLLTNERPLATERIVHITSQIAAALGAAHSIGIVHRDLKPDNIMITRKGDDADYVKVLDFGIAKPVDEDEMENLTKTGFVLGTPFYMSPEQISGDKLDARSDVYSLALIVYEMFSGRLPFEGDNSQAIMIKRLVTEPTPLRDFVPTMSPEVERAVMSGLERDRNLRAASVEMFATQLKNALVATQMLSNRQTHPVSDEAIERATIAIPEHRTNVEQGTDIIGSLKASPSALPGSQGEVHHSTIELDKPGYEARQYASPGQEERLSSPSAFITKESGNAVHASPNQPGAADGTGRITLASEKLNQQFPAAPVHPSPYPDQQAPANFQTPQQPFYQPTAPPQFQAQAPPQPYPTPVSQQPKGKNNAILISAVAGILLLVLVGGGYFLYTNYFSSNPLPPPAVTTPPASSNTDLPNLAKDSPTVPTTPTTRSDVEEADTYYERGKQHQKQAYDLLSVNSQAEAIEENKQAIEEYKKAIALRPVFPQAHENLGVAYYGTGNFNAAIAEYQTAIDQYKQQQKPPTAQVLTNYGLALFDLKRYREAADYFQRAYETDSTDIELLVHRGFALHNAGDVAGAKVSYNQYLQAAPNGQYAETVKEIVAGRAKPPTSSGN